MSGFLRDCRIAARSLAKARGFSATVILTLALGVGASSAMFSMLRATLLRPPPFPEPERLAIISLTERNVGQPARETMLPNEAFDLIRKNATSFQTVAAYTNPNFNVRGYDQAERIVGEVVSANYFRTLRVVPVSGRDFREEEDSIPGSSPVAVVSYDLWRRRFGGDPALVGKQLSLNRISLLVIGIMPPGFRGLSGKADVWIPRAMAPTVSFPYRSYVVVARLRPDRTAAQARSELDLLARRLTAAFPEMVPGAAGRAVTTTTLSQARIDRSSRTSVLILFGAVGMLLAIACANISNLLLVRAQSREREIAVRLAVGSNRWHLVRLLLAESILLAAIGGAAGLLLGYAGITALAPLVPARPPGGGAFQSVGEFSTPRFDSVVLLFSLVVMAATAILFGLAPAARASRADPVETLKGGRHAPATAGWRFPGLGAYTLLTVGEIALAVVLLTGSGLLLRSLWRLETLPLGFETADRLTFQIQAPQQWYSPVRAPVLVERVVDAISKVPGVSVAAASFYDPFDPGARHPVRLVGSRGPTDGELMAGRQRVTPEYFPALGIPLRRGRWFTADDRLGRPPVAVVSEAAAQRFWPGQDVIGKRFFLGSPLDAPLDSAVEVIGIVGDVHYRPSSYRVEPDVYTPYYQFASFVWAVVIVRSATPPMALVPQLRQAVMAVDPDLPIAEVQTMEERGGNRLARRRLNAVLLTIFAGLALAIATVGVYGVIAHQTAQRTRELGIRIAVGATGRDVFRVIMGRAVGLIGAGIGLGVLVALALTRVLSSQLYGVSAADPVTFLIIGGVLAGAALSASYLPARRAAKADPLAGLRAE
ncbi:MAG: ABC transporter permease [Gemmatimonadetes bacterium]|nr:ABC transporter permease [Gemmatimonadota bacterium]